MDRILTNFQGVYQRKSATRKHNGKADICFEISYKRYHKKIYEKIGWSSEGITARIASNVRSERLRNLRLGEEFADRKSSPFFQDAFKKYLEWAKFNKTRNGNDEKSRYKKIEAALADKRLSDIKPFDLEQLKQKLFKEGYSSGSVKHCLILVREIYNKAILWGDFRGINPIKGVKLPVLNNQRERFLSYEEANLLLNELKVDQRRTRNPGEKKDPMLHDMTLLSLHCGLRAGEIFNLRGQDLDFENAMIHIADPKNRSARKAFMTETVKDFLLRRKPAEPNDLVFPDRNGEKIVAVSRAFYKAIDRLGFNKGITDIRQRFVFHSLRHTFASWLALNNETLLTIKELLGHKTLIMTIRYAHLIPDHKRDAVRKLENSFIKNNGNKEMIDGKG